MQAFFYGLAALACPLGMGLMMWMMMRGQRQDTRNAGVNQSGAGESGDRLGQIAELRAEIDELKTDRAARGVGGQ